MGFLSDVLGLNNSVSTSAPGNQLAPYQQQANQLTGQLQTEAAGGGPNPAQQQFLQNSQAIAQQGATNYAQNRSLNPGLAARMAGNTAANVGQNAAATAGIQQAQQQLAAQGQLSNTIAQQEQAANQASGIAAGIGAGNQQQAGNLVGGILNGAGSAAALLAAYKGGKIQKFDDGGIALSPMGSQFGQPVPAFGLGSNLNFQDNSASLQSGLNSAAAGKPKSATGAALSGIGKGMESSGNPLGNIEGFAGLSRMSKGGKVPAMVSPGEKYLTPGEAKKVASGKADPMKTGKTIPGKAKVAGDSPKNDTVYRKLDDGGVVVNRNTLKSNDPKEIERFVANALQQHMGPQKSDESDFKSALQRAIAGRKKKSAA